MIWSLSILEYLAMGGWVMIPLILLAFLMGILITERTIFYRELRRENLTPEDVISAITAPYAVPPGGTGLLSQLLKRLLSAKKRYGRFDQMIIEEVTKGFLVELTRNLKLIGGLTSAAPLLGLLGTVSGMITTFNIMNVFGTGNAKAMSSGISQALITTQFGLVVAIIGLYLSTTLSRRAQHFETVIHELRIHLIRKCEA